MKKFTDGKWDNRNPHEHEVWTDEDRFVAKFDKARYANVACMAVNGTFAKGIDAERIPEAIAALEEAKDLIEHYIDLYEHEENEKEEAARMLIEFAIRNTKPEAI